MKRADLIFLPDAAAHLSFMSHQFGASYPDAIWHLREIEQRRRNEVRAAVREKLGALISTIRRPQATRPGPSFEIVPSNVIEAMQRFRNALAACL